MEGQKRSLLKKYDIPISHLDFQYVKNCTNVKELERIIKILRSGEEGYYPDLTQCAEDCLRVLKPDSQIFRIEEKLQTKHSLGSEEWTEHNKPIIDWSADIKSRDKILTSLQDSPEKIIHDPDLPPIRKTGTVSKDKKVKSKIEATDSEANKTRIASTDYDSWNKYDPNTEILKMDLEEERLKEQMERDKKAKQKTVEKTAPSTNRRVYDKLTAIEREKLSEEYRMLGNECFKSKEYSTAFDHYSKCINLKSTAAGFNNRAITNIKLEKYNEAISDCDECLRLDPRNLKALLRKAEAFMGLQKKLDAFHTYEQIINLYPQNIAARQAIDNLRLQLGDVAPISSTRISIVEEVGDNAPTSQIPTDKIMVKTQPKSEPVPKPTAKPESKIEEIERIPDYDLTELIKPNKLIKNQAARTMEALGKLSHLKEEKTSSTIRPQPTATEELKLQLVAPGDNSKRSKTLIQEL